MSQNIAIELLAKIDSRSVEDIVLTPTQCLGRGRFYGNMEDTLKPPAGDSIAKKIFDVFGYAMTYCSSPTTFNTKYS